MPSTSKTSVEETNEDPYALTAWGEPIEYDYKCPSGQLCRIRQIQLDELITGEQANLLQDTDFLTGIVESEHNPTNRAERRAKNKKAGVTEDEAAAKALKDNPEQTKKFLAVLDEIVLQAVLAPQIYRKPENSADRIAGRVYIDSVKFNDKIAIFQEAMKGTGTLQQFREDTAEDVVGAVEDGKGVRDAS